MDAKTYQAQYSRTLADVFFPENVNPLFLGLLLAGRKQTADVIDAAKRGLFYGNTKKLEQLDLANAATNILNIDYDDDPSIIHAVLGLEGEVSEISEAALDDSVSDTERRARVVDESGDVMWYLHLLFDQFDPPITMGEVLAGNIAKLAKRYPDKFTTDAAVNRDLAAEALVFSDAVITSAHISELSAPKITAGSTLEGTITVH